MRYFMWTALAAGLVLGASSASRANDTVRLGGPSAQAAIEGGTDSELVRWRGGYYGGRGYYAGFRGGYYGGYGRYYRPYYGISFYYPSYYASGYYSSAYYGGCASPYAYPISATVATLPPPITLQQSTYLAPQSTIQPMPPVINGNGTYQYNGGPNQFVPMPPANDFSAPMKNQGGIVPLDGKLVSLPSQVGGGVSLVSTPANQGWKTAPNAGGNVAVQLTPTRIAYPAYGENSVPTPLKTTR